MARYTSIIHSVASLIAGFFFAYLAYKFFSLSIAWLAVEPPRVTAGLIAGLAGFTATAASVTLLRDWIIVERAAGCRGEGRGEKAG